MEIVKCDHCGWNVDVISAEEGTEARILYGEKPAAITGEWRYLRFGDTAALHHICRNTQLSDASNWEREKSWWACKEPDREPDEWLRYDLHCAECARWWVRNQRN
jgi:hypothetical protein